MWQVESIIFEKELRKVTTYTVTQISISNLVHCKCEVVTILVFSCESVSAVL